MLGKLLNIQNARSMKIYSMFVILINFVIVVIIIVIKINKYNIHCDPKAFFIYWVMLHRK